MAEGNHYVLTTTSPQSKSPLWCIVSLKELSVTYGNTKKEGEEFGVKLSIEKGEGKVFSLSV